MKMLRSLALLSAFSAAIACAGTASAQNAIGRIGDVSIPQVTVNFGMEPYPPHTDAIIGLDKGWFKDVGIDLQWKNVQADQVAPLLIAGTVDVASAAPALLIPSMRQAKFDSFVFGDIFQAYAIMAQPDAGYKSYKDFVAQGKAPADALKAAMQQLKGKVFTYPAEAAVKPFIQLLFKRGDLALEDTTTEVQPDPNGVALMLSKRADFEIGGLPARITLEQAGYKQIVTAADLASAATASPDSEELRSITHVGWTTTQKYAAANHDTLLRLASVKFRIVQYQKDHMDDAIAIHLPFLNKLAGTTSKPEDLKVIYTRLDPGFTFKQQASWFNDPKDPFYWSYEIDSIIKSYVEQGLFKAGEFKAADISTTNTIYQELDRYRQQAQGDIAKLKDATGQAAEFRDAAQKHFDAFNFLDASRYAAAGVKAH
jgi:ABC-type nitrate/sulfonate/bicarbonate transport system substrate-binding protein